VSNARRAWTRQLGLVGVEKRRSRPDLESTELRAVRQYLGTHPRVAWHARINGGAMEREYQGRKVFVRFNDPPAGTRLPDVIGQLRDGRFLAFECKAKGSRPLPEQQAFLDLVDRMHGVSGWGGIDEAIAMMEGA